MFSAMLTITAMIYSGLPNPSWTVDRAREKQLLAAIEALEPRPGPCPDSGGLGYSGIQVSRKAGDGEKQRWLFHGGFVAADGKCYLDPERRIEKWLVETGKAHLSKDEFEEMH
ncbi:MAG: hypothetical protein ACI9TB_001446 [Parasphingorhabdus sp.]|jgi:hypothetical protein|uniref:hypothetical protein n=1 Tax=Parasphingorhabdus sp. TaxID=2709688 RepID=UPI0039E6F7CC